MNKNNDVKYFIITYRIDEESDDGETTNRHLCHFCSEANLELDMINILRCHPTVDYVRLHEVINTRKVIPSYSTEELYKKP